MSKPNSGFTPTPEREPLQSPRLARSSRLVSGFTLIELLIYVTIFALVAGFFTSILLIALRVQTTQSGIVDISGQLNFAMQTIQRHVQEATAITSPASGVSANSLTITKPAGPITIFLGSCGAPAITDAICVTEAGVTTPITTNKAVVNTLTFSHLTTPSSLPCPGTPCLPSIETIQISMSAVNNTQNPADRITRTLNGSASKLSQ